MATTEKVLSALILDLQRMVDGLQASAAELGELGAETAVVQALLNDLDSLSRQQAQLQNKIKEAKEKRSRLVLSLKGRYGRKSQKLETFGITVKSE